jgi:hypothetical protein
LKISSLRRVLSDGADTARAACARDEDAHRVVFALDKPFDRAPPIDVVDLVVVVVEVACIIVHGSRDDRTTRESDAERPSRALSTTARPSSRIVDHFIVVSVAIGGGLREGLCD